MGCGTPGGDVMPGIRGAAEGGDTKDTGGIAVGAPPEKKMINEEDLTSLSIRPFLSFFFF